MTIKLYKNNSESNKVNKDLTELQTLTGNLREGTSIISPVITVTDLSNDNIKLLNYIYIQEFNRYYFVNDIASLRNNVWVLSCNCDVLQSFKDDILNQTAVVRRQENLWNLYLDDGIFKTYQNPKIICKKFPNSFNNTSFVLAISGS